MSLAEASVKKSTFTWFTTAILLIMGIASFFQLGQLEDPAFTVKTAVVVTTYPGASAEEVELEVTDRIEMALQEMPQLKQVYSSSRAGKSLIKVDIIAEYSADELGQIWDELRKKVRDIRPQLPPGAGKPNISDDFGDVYGFFMAVVGDGFSYGELERYVDHIKKELSLVKGVGRVELWGVQSECIYVEVKQAQVATLGLNMDDVLQTLTQQNLVVDGGGIDLQDERLRFQVTGEFTSIDEIGDLIIRGRQTTDQHSVRELTRVRDVAEIKRGYAEPPAQEMRFNGRMAIGMSLSNVAGVNIVKLGRDIDARIDELVADLPIGIEMERISWQSDLVDESINNFMVSLGQAVAIVLVVLWIAMGLRTALLVGICGLILTIIASFIFMKLGNIDLQRMSLGALVIAMGMMVDNAIVVADGIMVRLQKGMDKVKAAVEAATQPSMPLLGATVIAVMTFYPIAASKESAGEYCASLFSVVAISLGLSWVLAVTITPLMGMGLIKAPKGGNSDPYAGVMFRVFKPLLKISLRFRWAVLIFFIALLGVSGYAFKYVDQMFFPNAARTQFMIDYWAPLGTRIQETSRGLAVLEERLLKDERIASISTFVGQGPPRFYLPVSPEDPYSSYGQLLVNTVTLEDVESLLNEIQPWADENIPHARIVARKYGLGPFEPWPVEARFSGPAIADPDILRDLARQGKEIMEASPESMLVRMNWRNRVKKMVVDYDQTNARWTSVTRAGIAETTRRGYDGITVGEYREQDKILAIKVRHTEPERKHLTNDIEGLRVRPSFSNETIPLSQVTSNVGIEWEDPLIWRWDRRRAITVQAVPRKLATTLRAEVIEAIEAIELPPGYSLNWDGEYLSASEAQQSLIPGMIPMTVIVLLIIVALFNAFRPPIIILAVIPFVLIGITIGLLATGQPFGFVALLGAMSLAGMMIKNAIVLLDQVNIELAEGKTPYEAVFEAAMSRLRPVVLAAGTTILGVVPLLPDVFWVSMAVVIMFGLAVGTLLTMILVPVLYCILFRVKILN
ncbi:efflux RND transporter permease subunit [Planctomycetota bacterium]